MRSASSDWSKELRATRARTREVMVGMMMLNQVAKTLEATACEAVFRFEIVRRTATDVSDAVEFGKPFSQLISMVDPT